MKKIICLVLVLCGLTSIQARQRQNFDADWLFVLGDSTQMSQVDYNDSYWRRLNVPHDWAREGDFFVGNPSGAGGGALPGGIGWYRKHFEVKSEEVKREKFFLEFDGVYMNSTVYVNGQKVGFRPYGYSSFEYDITPYIKQGENVVAVRVDNSDQPNSRWYSGCGIYRHVWLTKTSPIHVKHWGVFVHDGKVEVDYENPTKQKVIVKNSLIDQSGKTVATTNDFSFDIPHSSLHLWSCEDPYI